MNVAEIILDRGEPNSPAVFFGRESLTYAELRSCVRQFSGLAAGFGLPPGARVGLVAENSPFFIAAYLGIIRAGLCAVPLSTDCSTLAFERIAASTGMKFAVVSKRFLPAFQAMASQLSMETITDGDDAIAAVREAEKSADVDPETAPAAVMFTSGSAGEPKGVAVTHRNILVNTQDILAYMGIGPGDRAMVVLPFSHCFGLSLLHTHLMAGGSVVLNNRFMFAEKMLDEMVEKECTGLAGVPATYQILLRKTRFAVRNFPSLRWLQQAGGRLPNPFIQELRAALPNVKLFVMYGQTEATARLSFLDPDRLGDKLGSIGRGLPHVRLEVLRPDGTPVAPGSDEIGEIAASGESIAAGYWNDAAETAKYFCDGRLFTGDMARVDSDGFIFIVERARDFIKSMGYRVSPKEIEDVLAEIPEIVESAVIGMSDVIAGEAVRAFIVPSKKNFLTADAVRRHCLARLPNYKIPQQIDFVPSLPKLANGKTDKESLRRLDV